MTTPKLTLSALPSLIGQELGQSNWHVMAQQRITTFADATDDHQFIHTDPARAAATPFGGTIAHGFLVLSMLSAMFYEAVGEIEGATMSMNYGFDRIRFLKPVGAGSSIRGTFVLKDHQLRQPGQHKLTMAISVEIKGESKPALVADWSVLLIAEHPQM